MPIFAGGIPGLHQCRLGPVELLYQLIGASALRLGACVGLPTFSLRLIQGMFEARGLGLEVGHLLTLPGYLHRELGGLIDTRICGNLGLPKLPC